MKLLFILLSIGWLSCTPTPSTEFENFLNQSTEKNYTLLIQNGQIVDGLGNDEYSADLLIQDDTIAFIGQVDTALIQVKKTIDAAGKVVTPGFIDMHSHGNPLKTPEFKNFLAMGATTISLGKDGSSPDYENLAEWMQLVADTVPGVNIAMFVGHGTLRMQSGIKYNPRPSDEQLEVIGQLLEQNLDAGCFGMTTGLEYIPGFYAPAYELEHLAKIVGEKNKLITSHVRNEDDNEVESSIRELLDQGKFCRVNVSHMKVVYGQGESRAEEILNVLNQARRDGVPVTADVYPYTASYTGISILFPEWAKPPNNYQQVVATRRAELEDFLRNKVNQRNGPEATLLGTAPYAGKNLAQLSEEMDKPFEDILIDDIQPGGASGAYFVMNDSLQSRFIADSLVMISSDGSPTSRHPRGHGTFARIIEKFIVQDSVLTLADAVRKMTSMPAQTMGITDRGTIAVGKKADVLIFDPKQVHETATYENPFQLAEGINFVIVNGKISSENGEYSSQRNGQMLRKQ
ncbi:MAG: amidohydrolase family protein [Tunicatimonas sp.]|uniref:N-acyl-D-amino-acid deacylase family protein n=1 Tax=Tunicatimonas sp. TaxID=1940096 RepID=UPI003C789CC1